MAKSKKPAKPAASKKPKKSIKKASPAKPKAKPKPAAAKPAKKSSKVTKATKTSGSGKSKKPVKPKNGTAQVSALLAPGTITIGGGGAIATPRITSPLANAQVPAGVDLAVTMTTDQTGFRYILTLTDVTPPPPPPPPPALPPPIVIPVPVNFNIAAPGASPFNSTIPGANFVAGHSYRLRLFVDPRDGATPPNLDHTIPLTA